MKNVFLLFISKKCLLDGEVFNNWVTHVGADVDSLMLHIFKTYKVAFDDLIKDESDDFPYFTDGGFKYKTKTEYWEYTFTCYPTEIIGDFDL